MTINGTATGGIGRHGGGVAARSDTRAAREPFAAREEATHKQKLTGECGEKQVRKRQPKAEQHFQVGLRAGRRAGRGARARRVTRRAGCGAAPPGLARCSSSSARARATHAEAAREAQRGKGVVERGNGVNEVKHEHREDVDDERKRQHDQALERAHPAHGWSARGRGRLSGKATQTRARARPARPARATHTMMAAVAGISSGAVPQQVPGEGLRANVAEEGGSGGGDAAMRRGRRAYKLLRSRHTANVRPARADATAGAARPSAREGTGHGPRPPPREHETAARLACRGQRSSCRRRWRGAPPPLTGRTARLRAAVRRQTRAPRATPYRRAARRQNVKKVRGRQRGPARDARCTAGPEKTPEYKSAGHGE